MKKNKIEINKEQDEAIFVPVNELVKRLRTPRFPDMLYTDKAVSDAQKLGYAMGLNNFKKSIRWNVLQKKLRKEFRNSRYDNQIVKIVMDETFSFICNEFKK